MTPAALRAMAHHAATYSSSIAIPRRNTLNADDRAYGAWYVARYADRPASDRPGHHRAHPEYLAEQGA